MNCLEAQALLSAAHDGEPVDDEMLAAARSHCDQCPECTAFEAGLRYLDSLPLEAAPPDMVSRVMEAVVPLAAVRDEMRNMEAELAAVESLGLEAPTEDAAEVADETGDDALETVVTPTTPAPTPAGGLTWFAGPVRWATFGAAAALAAAALIAFVVVGIGSNGARTGETASTSGSSAPLDLTYGAGSNPAATDRSAAPAAPAAAPTPARAPDYVAFHGFVYAPGALLTDSSAATPTIGTLTTAFASGGQPAAVNVFKSPLSDGSIVVASPDGMRLYAPVIRMLSSARYQLASGKPLDRFGTWPTLPDTYATPADANGAPTFVAAGTDALGVTVFAAVGHTPQQGFAIAPGTSATDPAGGNPNWTWWLPAPANP